VETLISRLEPYRMNPDPRAILPNGEPDTDFRQKAKQLWRTWSPKANKLGSPGKGGCDLLQLFEMALRETFVGGECLFFFRRYTQAQADKLGLDLPLTVEVIESERIDSARSTWTMPLENGDHIYEGVEVDDLGRRVRFWVFDHHPQSPITFKWTSKPLEA